MAYHLFDLWHNTLYENRGACTLLSVEMAVPVQSPHMGKATITTTDQHIIVWLQFVFIAIVLKAYLGYLKNPKCIMQQKSEAYPQIFVAYFTVSVVLDTY